MAKPHADAPADHRKTITQTIERLAHRHSTWQVLTDFAEMAAISISNTVDWPQRDAREERYLAVVKRYDADELACFPQMFAALVMAMEVEPFDVLGRVFHDLELHNKYAGQYFSPYPLCRMMAAMTVSDGAAGIIAERGYVTVCEPACGSGAMVIAIAHELREQRINYQQAMHVTAVDVDIKCVHMAYVQFALLHIPAIIVHGNSLSLEEHGRWYTPAHILHGWQWKLKRDRVDAPALLEPTPAIAPQLDTPALPPAARPTQLTLF